MLGILTLTNVQNVLVSFCAILWTKGQCKRHFKAVKTFKNGENIFCTISWSINIGIYEYKGTLKIDILLLLFELVLTKWCQSTNRLFTGLRTLKYFIFGLLIGIKVYSILVTSKNFDKCHCIFVEKEISCKNDLKRFKMICI